MLHLRYCIRRDRQPRASNPHAGQNSSGVIRLHAFELVDGRERKV